MPMDLKNKKWEMNPNDPEVVATILIEEAYIKRVREGFSYARQLRLYLCPLESHQAPRVERALLYQLQPLGTRPGTQSPPSEIGEILHSKAAWLTEKTKRQIKSILSVV
jgi:hypothetical protein